SVLDTSHSARVVSVAVAVCDESSRLVAVTVHVPATTGAVNCNVISCGVIGPHVELQRTLSRPAAAPVTAASTLTGSPRNSVLRAGDTETATELTVTCADSDVPGSSTL